MKKEQMEVVIEEEEVMINTVQQDLFSSSDTYQQIENEANEYNIKLQLKYSHIRPYAQGIKAFKDLMDENNPPINKILGLHYVK